MQMWGQTQRQHDSQNISQSICVLLSLSAPTAIFERTENRFAFIGITLRFDPFDGFFLITKKSFDEIFRFIRCCLFFIVNLLKILLDNILSKSISIRFFSLRIFSEKKGSFIEECHWNLFELMTKSLFPSAIYLGVSFFLLCYHIPLSMFMHLCAQNIWCFTKAASRCTRLKTIHWEAFLI